MGGIETCSSKLKLVQLFFKSGRTNSISDDDLAERLGENMAPFAGPEQTAHLARHLDAMETRSVRDLAALLVLADASEVDSVRTA